MRSFLSLGLSVIFAAWPAVLLIGQKAPIKWGEVPADDLAMTVYAPDTAADAVVLADFGELSFDFTTQSPRFQFERHRRVKILRRSAFERGDVSLSYYSYQNRERIYDLKAQVITPDGQTVALRSKDFFEEKVSDKLTRIRFTFPNMQEGAVIEYQYRLTVESVFTLPTWYFQGDIPVRWSEYRLHIPDWYRYVTVTNGGRPEIEEKNRTQGQVYYQDNTAGGRSGNIDVGITNFRYARQEAPALREEAYITTMDDYLARIGFQLGGTNFQVYKPVLTDWPSVAKELMDHAQFGQQFTKSRNYKEIVDAALPFLLTATTPEEKVRRSYTFLARQMEWDESHRFLVRTSLNDCFRQKKASSGELNLMLIALLREQGVQAQPLLVSTRDNGRMVQEYPILDQFNHVMAMVPLGDQNLAVDLGSPYRPLGLPRVSSLNTFGWLAVPDNPQWVQVPVMESKSVIMADLSVDEQGVLSGRLRHMYSGYNAVAEREAFARDSSGKHLEEEIRTHFPEARVDSFHVEKLDRVEEPLTTELFFHIPQAVPVAGDFLYISPVLLPALTENPFRPEKRLFPVDIPYPFNEQYVLNLLIPDGYELVELPSSVNLVTDGEGARYSFVIQQKSERQIQIVSRLMVRQLHYEADQYPALREIFARLIQKQGEQIVLRKKIG